MSTHESIAGAWSALDVLDDAVLAGWLSPLRAAFAGAELGIWRSGWWTAEATGRAFDHPVALRLAARSDGAGAVLTVSVTGYVAPSQVFGALVFDGASQPTALDFFGLTDPVLYVSSADVPAFDPEGGGDAVELSQGLTLTGTVPDTSRLDAFPRAITRPLKYLLDDTYALPAGLTVQVGSKAATASLTMQRDWTPIDGAGLKLTLSDRRAGVRLARSGSGSVPAEEAPRKTERDGSRTAAAVDEVTLQTDVDLEISLIGDSLPFPKDDTARLTLGAGISGGGGGGDARADGWLRLRDDASPWNTPFGLPSATIEALYGRVDLAKKALRAFRGRGRFAGQGFDVGLVLAPERSGNLVALRNDDDISLLGIGAALFDASGAPSIPGPVLVAQPARGTDPAADVDPEDYAIYFTTGSKQLDGKSWPPGLRVRGTVRFWSVIEAGVDLGVTWGDGPVEMKGAGLSMTFAGVGCTIDLGGMLEGLPLRVVVTRDLQIYVEADYRLSLGGFSVDGTMRLDANGAHFDPPGNGGLWTRDPDIGLTGISAPDGGLKKLRVDAFVSKTLSLGLPAGPLPNGLVSLPGTSISAVGELHFAVDVATDPSAVGASVTRLVGRIPALGLHKTFATDGVHIDVNDLASAAAAIGSTVRAWAKAVIDALYGDLFGQIPVLGPLLRNAFGLADEAMGRMFSVAGELPGGKALGAALGEAGVAFEAVDEVIGGALDWAHDNGLPTNSSVGRWATKGAGAGLDAINQALSLIPGFDDTLGKWAGSVGGLFRKKHDNAPDAEARDKASNVAADGEVAVLYQQRELGGASFALPLGRYPKMPPALRPDGDGAGANSMVLPRGWTAHVFAEEDFGGESSWFDVTTNDMHHWVDRARSVEILHHGVVLFFEDSHYRGTSHKSGPGSNDRDDDDWVGEVSSIIVPPGFEVDLWNERGHKKTLASSTHSVGWLFGKGWNDKIKQANVRRVPRPPVRWQTPSTIAFGSTSSAQWQTYDPQKMVTVHVDLSRYGFARPPRIFTTLDGDSTHALAYGVNAPFRVTPTGFSVYVGLPGQAVPLADVRGAWSWRLNWVAVADDAPMIRQGSTAAFEDYGSDGYGLMTAVHHDPARVDGVAAPALTSLRGESTNPFQSGGGSSYHVGEGGLSVYLRGGLDRFDAQGDVRSVGSTIDAQRARDEWHWQLDWCRPLFGRAGYTHGATRLHADRTAPGAGWQPYEARGLTLWVDTRDLDLPPDTTYITAISGASSHWTLTGGSAVYEASAQGFRIYVFDIYGSPITPALARAGGWHIHWMAIGSA